MAGDFTQKRIHIFSAPGAGATTLGGKIAAAGNMAHFDADRYIWQAEIPPFGKFRNRVVRNSLLDRDLRSHPSWVLSGSICGWGDFAIRFFNLAIFLVVPEDERMKRYVSRYTGLFGHEILESGHPLHQRLKIFLDWATTYNERQTGFCRSVHVKWLQKLTCPVIRIEGNYTPEETLEIAREKMQTH